jgi:hypothetical protein
MRDVEYLAFVVVGDVELDSLDPALIVSLYSILTEEMITIPHSYKS